MSPSAPKPINQKPIERGGGVRVNELRPHLEIHLRYVGFLKGTPWLRGPGSTKNLVRPPLRSCNSMEGEEA